MDNLKVFDETLAEHLSVTEALRQEGGQVVDALVKATIESLRAGGKICFFGNGGSAADSQHLSTEFVVRFVRQRRSLPSIAFTTDTSILTAAANDFGYDEVFARQVEGLCTTKDVVVGISTSGKSRNVVRGLEQARSQGCCTVAFTGRNGGPCAELADIAFKAPSDVTARIQECHILVGHVLCDLVEAHFASA